MVSNVKPDGSDMGKGDDRGRLYFGYKGRADKIELPSILCNGMDVPFILLRLCLLVLFLQCLLPKLLPPWLFAQLQLHLWVADSR